MTWLPLSLLVPKAIACSAPTLKPRWGQMSSENRSLTTRSDSLVMPTIVPHRIRFATVDLAADSVATRGRLLSLVGAG